MTNFRSFLNFRWLITSLYTRKCRGCDDSGIHNAHLTKLGRIHYTRHIPRYPRKVKGGVA